MPASPLHSLSPRRRALVLGAGALAVAAVAAGAVAGAGGGAQHDPAPQDRPGPVVLVPGYGGSADPLRPLAAALRADGRAVEIVALPGGATGALADQAAAVDAAVTRAEGAGAPSVDVVGFSDGGLVARYWARHDGGAHRARRIVPLASPHHGTDLATAAVGGSPGLCPRACRDVAPDSAFLAALNARDETPDGPRWVSVYSTTDGVVRPADSARLTGATNVVLQRVCPDDAARHSDVPRDPLAIGIVRAALGTEPPTQPTPADCTALRASGAASPGR